MDEKGLGKRLQDARRAAGLTQQELCHKATLSYSTLAKIERGAIKSPSIFTIQNIAAALGTSLDVLIGAPVPTALLADEDNKHQSKSGVKFVYFDINGCLVHFFQGAFVKLAHDTSMPADAIETAFWHYNDEVCRGTIALDDFNKAFSDRIGVDAFNWADYYFAAVEPVAGMKELVEWTAENYHVGLLTNIMPGFVATMRERKLLPSVNYEHIIDSSEVGAIKPEPQIYEIAAEKSGFEPHEILLIDDSRPNLMAAEKFDWHVLWFDSYRPEEAIGRIRNALEISQ
jgi:FMN phosphatase YigB (HAD superfamily)/DNA-binding XRE family transcriptional regulator